MRMKLQCHRRAGAAVLVLVGERHAVPVGQLGGHAERDDVARVRGAGLHRVVTLVGPLGGIARVAVRSHLVQRLCAHSPHTGSHDMRASHQHKNAPAEPAAGALGQPGLAGNCVLRAA